MPELFLTETCDQTCGGCSCAGSAAGTGPPGDLMGWEDLIFAADFLLASGECRLNLSGGEPGLHPEFPEMAAYLLERGFEVGVSTAGFADGYILEKSMSLLAGYHPQRLFFHLNLDPLLLKADGSGSLEGTEKFLQIFGDRCFPAMRLADADFTLTDPVRLISEYGMSRNLNLGLRHPDLGDGSNVPGPGEISKIVDRIFSFQGLLERFRIQPILACGWPMCCFSDDHLAWLGKNTGRCDFTCGPTIGIGPDMSVFPCFPLLRFRNRSLFEFDSLSEIHHMYLDAFTKVNVESAGIFPACDTCRYRDLRRCEGGCLVHNVLTFLDEEPLRLPEVYP